MAKLSEARSVVAYYLTEPVVRLLSRTPVTPSMITWLGFLLAAGAVVLIVTEHLVAAGSVMLVAGFFDMLDGALARRTERVTRFGAFLDSTLDRLSEAVILLGVLVLQAREQSVAGILLVAIALLGSLLVSYIRARAEALGLECQVGLFTRPERVVVLALGLLLSHFGHALIVALTIIVAFSLFTAGQRLFYVWRQMKIEGS